MSTLIVRGFVGIHGNITQNSERSVVDEMNNLLEVGKTACFVLGEDQAIIYYHIEYAANIWNDLCVDPKRSP